jgi:hypothetical protein
MLAARAPIRQVFTGLLLLYVPLTIYGYGRFLSTGQASVPTAIIAFAVGVSYQLLVGNALHGWRAKRRGLETA